MEEFVDFTRDVFDINKVVYLYPILLERIQSEDKEFIESLVNALRSIGLYASNPDFGSTITSFKIDPDIKIKDLIGIITSLREKIQQPNFYWYLSVDNNYIKISPENTGSHFTCTYVPRIDSPL